MSGFFGSIIGGLIGAAGNIFGASTAASGGKEAAETTGKYNERATKAVLDAQKEARAELRAASGRGLTAIDTGLNQYRATTDPLRTSRPILMPTYRGMTEQQELGQQDLNRNAMATLAASGLRGAGRSGVASVIDQNRRYIAGARGANDADTITERRRAQSASDAAISGLGGLEADTGRAKANTELLTGSQLGTSFQQGGAAAGNLLANTGSAYANAANTSGQLWGNAITSTARLGGQTIGALQASGASPNSGLGFNFPSFGGERSAEKPGYVGQI